MHGGNKRPASVWHLPVYKTPAVHLSSLTSQPPREVITSTAFLISNNIWHLHLALELSQHLPTGCLCRSVPLLTSWGEVAVNIVIRAVETCTYRSTQMMAYPDDGIRWAHWGLCPCRAVKNACEVHKRPLLFQLGVAINRDIFFSLHSI